MELPLFEQVGELARTLVSAEVGTLHFRSHRRGVKAWVVARPGVDPTAPRLHYEAQVIPRRFVDEVAGAALEIGFHAEDRDQSVNDAALDRLLAAERRWRDELGDEAEAGPFLGRPDDWRRCSETWIEPDLDDDEAAFEIASRLADYVNVLDPIVNPSS
ncbi:hypothetical protein [Actinospongicola halichondriae]|uniref:hypothetical protein n=1 Tax=Actinospongicola halichondriae TaxID=3236844 RepID=UPI003D3B4153